MVGLQVASGLAARPERFTGLIVALLAASAVAFAAAARGGRAGRWPRSGRPC
ncbi:hypothetical protein ACFSTC_59610 [Nonomuraea ferruginea]